MFKFPFEDIKLPVVYASMEPDDVLALQSAANAASGEKPTPLSQCFFGRSMGWSIVLVRRNAQCAYYTFFAEVLTPRRRAASEDASGDISFRNTVLSALRHYCHRGIGPAP